jgi:hypothetical protein
MAPAQGRETYAAFIKEQLDAEEANKTSLEGRAISVITTSGTLVTLLFALSSLLTAAKGFTQPVEATVPLRIALVGFVLAAVLALIVNLPLPYRFVVPGDLQTAVEEMWDDDPSTASKRTAATHVRMLRTAQKLNLWKGGLLLTATLSEVVAVGAVATAIWVILRSG